jgi:DNA-binding transcriptional MerR regulator
LEDKAPDAFRTISEVADELDLPQHVLRFWESRFREIRPLKRGGGRRYYRPSDIDLLRGIRHLLYGEGYTIRGVQRILREQGIKLVQTVWQESGSFDGAELKQRDDLVSSFGEATEAESIVDHDYAALSESFDSRYEPQLNAAVQPHSPLVDRIVYDAGSPSLHPATSNKTLSSSDLHTLQAALKELVECRNLIATTKSET